METKEKENLKGAYGFGGKVITGSPFEIVFPVMIGACV